MKKAIKLLAYVFTLVAFINLTVVSCSDEEEGGTLPSTGGGGGGGGGSPIDDIPVDVVEQTGFWVNVITDQFTVLIDKRGEYNTDCYIDADTTTNAQHVFVHKCKRPQNRQRCTHEVPSLISRPVCPGLVQLFSDAHETPIKPPAENQCFAFPVCRKRHTSDHDQMITSVVSLDGSAFIARDTIVEDRNPLGIDACR